MFKKNIMGLLKRLRASSAPLSRIPIHPFRSPAEMPKEEEPQVETSETIRIWKMVLTAMFMGLTLILGYCVFSTIHADSVAIQKSQIDSTPLAKEAAQARYLEAKALSDKAMFEQMSKAADKAQEKK